ncbi:ATP-binding protein [soil metagenome]
MDIIAEYHYATTADVPRIRREVQAQVMEMGLLGDRIHDAVLAISELMTNAIMHTETPRPRVLVDRLDGALRFGVTDTSPSAPQPRLVDPDRVGGNGLRIIAAVADDWGTAHHDGLGKTVWFTIASAADWSDRA